MPVACSDEDLRRMAMEEVEVPLQIVKLSMNPGHQAPPQPPPPWPLRVEEDY